MLGGRFLVAAAVFTGTALAAGETLTNLTDLTDLLAKLPSCSLDCLASGLASSGLGINNITASCTDEPLQAALSACIQGHCNFTEQIQVATVDDVLCKGAPIPDRKRLSISWSMVMGTLALVAVALRCYSRLALAREFGYDDGMILAAAVILATLLGIDIAASFNGFGRHYWDLSPAQIPLLLKMFWVEEWFYLLVGMLVRASLLLFYLRIFPRQSFKIADYIVLTINFTSAISLCFVVIFQCDPISGVWDLARKSKCIDTSRLIYISGGIGIFLDLAILGLPIPQLLGLKTSLRSKINLMIMFSLGGLATITSIVRLRFLVNFGNSLDQTWDNIIPAIWSLAEICVAIICACLPAIRVLFSRWLPSVFGQTKVSTSGSPDKSDSRKKSSLPSQPQSVLRDAEDGQFQKKRALNANDDMFLTDKDRRYSAKIWNSLPNFANLDFDSNSDEQGLVPNTAIRGVNLKPQNSSSSEALGYEGSQTGDEVRDFTGKAGIPLEMAAAWNGRGEEIRVIDSLSVRSERVDLR